MISNAEHCFKVTPQPHKGLQQIFIDCSFWARLCVKAEDIEITAWSMIAYNLLVGRGGGV